MVQILVVPLPRVRAAFLTMVTTCSYTYVTQRRVEHDVIRWNCGSHSSGFAIIDCWWHKIVMNKTYVLKILKVELFLFKTNKTLKMLNIKRNNNLWRRFQ